MVNKTPTGHLLPAPPANYEIFETSSKYKYLHTDRCEILCWFEVKGVQYYKLQYEYGFANFLRLIVLEMIIFMMFL